jgi:hypothetical protein
MDHWWRQPIKGAVAAADDDGQLHPHHHRAVVLSLPRQAISAAWICSGENHAQALSSSSNTPALRRRTVARGYRNGLVLGCITTRCTGKAVGKIYIMQYA